MLVSMEDPVSLNSHLGEDCPNASMTLCLLPVRRAAVQTSLGGTRHEPRLLFCQEKEGAG